MYCSEKYAASTREKNVEPLPSETDLSLSNDEAPVASHQINEFLILEKSLFSDSNKSACGLDIKVLNFERLVKENPFTRQWQLIDPPTNFKQLDAVANFNDVSILDAPSKGMENLSTNASPQDQKRVSFCKNTKTCNPSLGGILKFGIRCRYPRNTRDEQKEKATQHSDHQVPRFGKDWDILEGKIDYFRKARVTQSINHGHEEDESEFLRPRNQKQLNFMKKQILKLKKLVSKEKAGDLTKRDKDIGHYQQQ